MLVKCKGCGKKIDRNIAYKIVVNNKNQYYCNEKEYLEINKEKMNRMKVMEISKELLDNTTNTLLFKELNEIAKVYSYSKISQYLNENKIIIKNNMNKSFTNEYGKIRYFSAILKNNLKDFTFSKNEIEHNVATEFCELRYKRKPRKKSLNEYMEEYFKEDN